MCFLCSLERGKMSGREVTGKGQAAIPSSGTVSWFWGGMRMAKVFSVFPLNCPLADLTGRMKSGLGHLPGISQLGTLGKTLPFE